MIAPAKRSQVVVVLGIAQMLAWASSYYLPAILADPIASDIGVPRTEVFAAFSLSLLITAFLGPSIGRMIDRKVGRGVLMLSNLVLSAGLCILAAASGPATLFIAWAVLGIGMALGLYDAAFAALASLYGLTARGPITGITLLAGFASTVSWPSTALLNGALGWRETCLVWAALHLCIGLPLNWMMPKSSASIIPIADRPQARASWKPYREMFLLAFVFAAAWFVTGAMGAHLPRLLQTVGATPVEALAAAALVGPAQVAARIGEFFVLRRIHPIVSTRVAALLHPIGAAVIMAAGPPAALAFVILYGAGNGLLTISRGTLPLAIFGPQGYGERTGLLGAPARMAQALAPMAFGLVIDKMGAQAIYATAGLCLAAFLALFLIRPAKAAAHEPLPEDAAEGAANP